ncbi:MAG: TadE/TadG family type IV pilus assembly protein [Pseudomonadota bacterium]|nr:TadE/TadG family type IV pilus assembly protein [Pseudomonadota bacterium]
MMQMRRKAIGAVALEFLMLFPFVVAMLYGAAVYGLTFFAQYRMQDAVDTAVSTALYIDRSENQSSDLSTAVPQRANNALAGLVAQLPQNLRENLNTASACGLETIAGGVEVLRCSLVYPNYQANPIVPVLSFGMLGDFPPLPAQLNVDARAAF